MARAWNAASRKKLTAIRHPEQGVPRGFYFSDRDAIAAELDCGLPYPETLTIASETERAKWLAGYRGVSWREPPGRNFTAEYTNALVGLWVHSEGFDFALDLLLPEPGAPLDVILGIADSLSYWSALRRYLFAAPQEEYDRLLARVVPMLEERFGHDDYKHRKFRDELAFAFSRQSDHADRLLQGYLDGSENTADIECLVAACTDAELVARVIEKRPWHSNTYHVFDIVESIGGAAADLLPQLNEQHRASDRKRILTAIKIAEKLKAAG